MTPPTDRSALALKVDILWKLVVLGAFSLAARLSWDAWKGVEESLLTMQALVHKIDARLVLVEDRSLRSESRLEQMFPWGPTGDRPRK